MVVVVLRVVLFLFCFVFWGGRFCLFLFFLSFLFDCCYGFMGFFYRCVCVYVYVCVCGGVFWGFFFFFLGGGILIIIR